METFEVKKCYRWNELVGNKVEFLEDTSEYGGIGFIQKI